MWEVHAGERLFTINNNNNDNNNNGDKKCTDKFSPYVKSSSSLYFSDKCERGKVEGEAQSRVQLTLFRPLCVILVGK